jgi:hypothetical protein
MGRRRLPALLALVTALLLGACGVVVFGLGPGAPSTTAPTSVSGAVRATEHDTFVLAGALRAGSTAVHPADRLGRAGGGLLRDAVLLPTIALLAIALAAFVGRQRRRSRPPTWHRAALFGRGPPLFVAA